MKILLVGNYAPDAQESMLRFGAMLRRGYAARGAEVVEIQPAARALGRRTAGAGLGKWLGYADKYLLFPRALRRAARAGADCVHVVDHSNAVYVPRRRAVPWIVTCHDLLAVRGALGEDTDCPASPLGRALQRRIVAGLARADAVACISESTRRDLERLVRPASAQARPVIPPGQNFPFAPLARDEALGQLAGGGDGDWGEPFLLHVGSNLARKNRAAVVRVLGLVRDRWPGRLVFAGAAPDEALRRQIAALGLEGRVTTLAGPSGPRLTAAYSLAHALVFPSTGEGFGWPVAEAQACGCPVICSDRPALPEVGGDAALVHALADEAGMAAAVLRLCAAEFRAGVVRRGFANARRFSADRMIDDYLALSTALPRPTR